MEDNEKKYLKYPYYELEREESKRCGILARREGEDWDYLPCELDKCKYLNSLSQ
jgi:hypothetical protein